MSVSALSACNCTAILFRIQACCNLMMFLAGYADETPDDPRDWSPLQVSQWMFERGLEQFVDTFLEHSIDGACLLCLSHEQLRDDLSISALGHRHRILRSVKELQEGKET